MFQCVTNHSALIQQHCPWTVIPLEERDTYMAALEEASVGQNIVPFSDFLAQMVDAGTVITMYQSHSGGLTFL